MENKCKNSTKFTLKRDFEAAQEGENTVNNVKNSNRVEKIGKVAKNILTIVVSFAVGAINGLFGGGGGMLVIPVMTLLLGLEEKKAHSSAILTILPLSLVSSLIYVIRGDFVLKSGGFVTAGVILGGILGTFVMKKLSNNVLSIVFYAIMIFAGISMLVNRI